MRRRANTMARLSVVSLLLATCAVTHSFPAESKLYHDLLQDYNKLARPITNGSEKVDVTFSVSMQTVELDVEQDVFNQNVWLNLGWKEPRMKWDPEEYGNVKSIRLMPDQLWMPDIIPYNMLPAASMHWLEPTQVVVSSDGSMLYVAPSALSTSCRMSENPPWIFQHECTVKFGSWTRNGFELDLVNPSVDTSSFVRNPRWNLIDASIQRNEVFYECCPEPYVDVSLKVILRDSKLPRDKNWPKPDANKVE